MDTSRRLPAAANLDHLKHQARNLQRDFAARDAEALCRVQQHLPAHAARAGVAANPKLTLTQAQLVIAREYGSTSWPELRLHLRRLSGYTTLSGPAPAARELSFPTQRTIGQILIRDWGSHVIGGFVHAKEMGFEPLCEARGIVPVPAGKEVRFVPAPGIDDIGQGLSRLQPDALQSIAVDRQGEAVRWTDEDCRHIARLTGLTWLSLLKTPVTDVGLRWIAELSNLNHLDLHWVEGITDEGLASLAKLRKIETFFGGNQNITDRGMAVFGGWGKSLRQVRITGDDITDAGMGHLARCRLLTKIIAPPGISWRGVAKLKSLPLTTLGLWDNRHIDDQALEMLAPLWEDMPSLEYIDLGATAISDAGLAHLRRLKQLKYLHITYKTKVTPEGMATLAKALPGIKFDH